MPELPEVEIVRQTLNNKIKQKTVKKVIVKNSNLRFKVPSKFSKILKNQKILKVCRFSKYLLIYLSNENICLVHLGMSGTIHIVNFKKKNLFTNASFYNYPNLPSKHNHIEIFFDNFKIVYNDPRRFGYFEIIKNKIYLKKRFSYFGPEPSSPEFNVNYVSSYLKKKEKNIKNFLLDQKFISGIGNIYASEILYLCRIRPDRKGKFFNKNDCANLIKNTKIVISDAINKGGSSIRNFKNVYGKDGQFQKIFKVYQREGENCKRVNCKGIILKKNISNRSSFFCNFCQKK